MLRSLVGSEMCIRDSVWELLGMDYVGPFKETENGNRYILTITDLFSKWPVAYACPDKKASSVAKKVLNMLTTYGFPCAILTDNGSEFCNAVFFYFFSILLFLFKKHFFKKPSPLNVNEHNSGHDTVVTSDGCNF